MDLLKTIICCNFNFELVTKAWTRQGKNVKEQAPTLQNECSKCWGISNF